MTDGTDPNAEALAALERLVRHHVITPEQARAAARIITGNPDFEFPAQPFPPVAALPAQKLDQKGVEGQGAVPSPPPSPPPADNASPAGSESL